MAGSPFQNLDGFYRKRLLWIFGVLTVLLLVVLRWVDGFLITEETPDGIVGFELVKNIHDARIMMDVWGDTGRIAAGFSLGIDYLFLISYSIFLGLVSFELGRKFEGRLRLLSKGGYFFSWLILVAGFYDAIENIALLKILTGCQLSIWAITAWFFATVKFAIVFLVLGYIALSFIFLLILPKENDRSTLPNSG
jgi:hypothetical protein